MSLRTDRVRITAGILRKTGVSKEDFDHFWLTEHPKLFCELEIVKKNILKYEQVKITISEIQFGSNAIDGLNRLLLTRL